MSQAPRPVAGSAPPSQPGSPSPPVSTQPPPPPTRYSHRRRSARARPQRKRPPSHPHPPASAQRKRPPDHHRSWQANGAAPIRWSAPTGHKRSPPHPRAASWRHDQSPQPPPQGAGLHSDPRNNSRAAGTTAPTPSRPADIPCSKAGVGKAAQVPPRSASARPHSPACAARPPKTIPPAPRQPRQFPPFRPPHHISLAPRSPDPICSPSGNAIHERGAP